MSVQKKKEMEEFRLNFRQDLTRFLSVGKVETDSSMVSKSPLYSEEYWYCCAYVLTDGNLKGLSHMIPTVKYLSYSYVKSLESMLRQFSSDKEIRGMPIAGKPEALEIMEGILQDHDVVVTNKFEPTMLGYRKGTARHILVPNVNEVHIYFEEYGQMRVEGF